MSNLLLFLPRGGSLSNLPTVTTDSPVIGISATKAVAGGNVLSQGLTAITERGIVISTSSNPTTSNTKYTSSGTLGPFTVNLDGLLPNTTYHVRAFATNSNGTSYGDDVSFTTDAAQVSEKSYIYRIYDEGVYVTTWTQEVLTDPTFRTNINGGPGEMLIELSRTFDNFGEDEDVKLNNKVDCYVVDKEAPNGRLLYSGYISGYKPVVDEHKETVEITVIGYVAELQRMILRDASGNTTLAYNSYDPSDILKDAIDKYRAMGGSLNYSASSVARTNTSVSYTFNTNTIKEVFDKIIELCPVGWYFRIQPDGYVYLQPINQLADHTFTLGKHIERLETHRRVEDLVNRVLFIGGGSPALFRKYENTGSQEAYGLYEVKIVDQRVTVVATAQTISERLIETRKDPEIRSKFLIVDSNGKNAYRGYDIESIQVGQTLKVKNLRDSTRTVSYWDQAMWDVDVWDQTLTTSAADVVQIMALQYNPDSIVVEASSRLPQVAKRIEDVNRNLEVSQSVNNPSAPS